MDRWHSTVCDHCLPNYQVFTVREVGQLRTEPESIFLILKYPRNLLESFNSDDPDDLQGLVKYAQGLSTER